MSAGICWDTGKAELVSLKRCYHARRVSEKSRDSVVKNSQFFLDSGPEKLLIVSENAVAIERNEKNREKRLTCYPMNSNKND